MEQQTITELANTESMKSVALWGIAGANRLDHEMEELSTRLFGRVRISGVLPSESRNRYNLIMPVGDGFLNLSMSEPRQGHHYGRENMFLSITNGTRYDQSNKLVQLKQGEQRVIDKISTVVEELYAGKITAHIRGYELAFHQ